MFGFAPHYIANKHDDPVWAAVWDYIDWHAGYPSYKGRPEFRPATRAEAIVRLLGKIVRVFLEGR